MAYESARPRVALVLAGGAARGAYEVGVVQHLLEEVSRDLGRDVPLDILCGTSIGALNACALAAFAEEPQKRGARLAKIWTDLSVERLVQPDLRGIFSMGSRWFRGERDLTAVPAREGGLVDPRAFEELIETAIPFGAIHGNIEAGRLDALTVSTTHVASGRTMVYVHRRGGGLPAWSLDPTITPRAVKIAPGHAFASAAIPILFRAVRLDGEFHCDGGLRQNVPLSPARRLGARGVIVVNPRYLPTLAQPEDDARARATEDLFPGPLFLLGKTLNALLLDRIDTDLARLRSINDILAAGQRRFGARFIDELNEELGHPKGRGMRPMRALQIRTSLDLGKLAAEFVLSPAFARTSRGVAGRLLRRLAVSDARDESDLLSYLLFDGEFARQLIELGKADARARHSELCEFFESLLAPEGA
ncbi:MAG: patatin-like phospholipase family protein [Myxococcales bacterium]|jgi:NTE family protein|nr:patatin-like phospholipase family protein [Myxococcales bacterium]HQY64532.1 patatin-like phospholipase family protein [Polyangiaceae bacterium]